MSVPCSSIRWSQFPLTFELHSSDASLLERAALLFQAWSSDVTYEAVCSWRIEPVHEPLAPNRMVWEIRSAKEAEIIERATLEQALMTVEFLSVQALVAHPHCLPSLHAALVARNGRGVVLLGRGEAGKSTLACALWRQGWSLLCDDISLIEMDCGVAKPTPRRVSLRAPSRALLGEELWARMLASPSCVPTLEGYAFHPYEVDGKPYLKEARLAAAIFLERPDSGAISTVARQLEPARALLAMLPYSNVARLYDFGEAIRRMRPLAATIPVYDLGRGPLADMLKSIETVLAEVA